MVALPDLARFGPHYDHAFSGGGISRQLNTDPSVGAVQLQLEEIIPLIGEHTLRATIRLEGIEAFEVGVFALRNENPKLQFLQWSEASTFEGETMCAEIMRDGERQCFIGVVGHSDETAGTILGTAEFRVFSDQEILLGEDDLAMVTADLLPVGGERQLSVTSIGIQRSTRPVTYKNALAQNYPNPFNPSTTLAFSLERENDVNLSIFDVRGALVRRLVDGRQARGVHRVNWDGMNGSGERVASGVYFYRIIAGSFSDTKKLTILK